MLKLLMGGKIDLLLLMVLTYALPAGTSLYSQSKNSSDSKVNSYKALSVRIGADDSDNPLITEFQFPGGFYLSGYNNGILWANGYPSPKEYGDYIPGPIGAKASDNYYPGEAMNMVLENDAPFGESWQLWRKAVAAGADFYDGDKDGVYDPVDKNKNGIWDPDEDRPDACGKVTYWRVDNDGLEPVSRKFKGIESQSIDIQRTAFITFLKGGRTPSVYVRFRIINRGFAAETLDSVYFAIASPSVTEENSLYLAGCDTSSASMFAYSNTDDQIYKNPPCYMISFLQGPVVSIPGVTFIDNNGNGIFDPGTDTPVNCGFNKKGKFKGEDSIQGAMNINMASFFPYYPGDTLNGEPGDEFELRNYMVGGLQKNGLPVNPCGWKLGDVNGLPDCGNLNPKFLYSGNPVAGSGWLNKVPGREVLLMSVGPFALKKNIPQDIFVTYVLGQGISATNSIEVARNYNAEGKRIFDKNLVDDLTDVENSSPLPENFMLEQNYPNPFNPSTRIKYSVAGSGKVTLKIYDIMGKEVSRLVNEEKMPGNYEVLFNAAGLSSGIYFYRLQSGNRNITKKMLLLK
jgi:hypothetical protein